MDKKVFYAPDIDISGLGQSLSDWFAGQGFQTQLLPAASGGATVQARKESTLRTLTGMSNALTVSINPEGENIGVEMGNAKWLDKGAAAAVGVLIFWPALVTAGVGAYQQNQIQNQAWQFIEQYIRANSAYGGSSSMPGASFGPMQAAPPTTGQQMGGQRVTPPMAVQPGMGGVPQPVNMSASGSASANCPQCGQLLRQGAKFCDNCGAPTVSTCKSCGKPLRQNARFCDECGAPVG